MYVQCEKIQQSLMLYSYMAEQVKKLMFNFSRTNSSELDLMELSVKQIVTTSAVLPKLSTQLSLIQQHYIKLPLKENTDCQSGVLSKSVSS